MTDPTPTELIADAREYTRDEVYPGAVLIHRLANAFEAQLAETARLQAELTRRDTMITELRERQTGLVRIVAAATPVPAKPAGSSSALEAVKADTTTEWLPERVHWGVWAGDHPAQITEYQSRMTAEWYLVHPFPANEGLVHTLVTRKTRATEWQPIEADGGRDISGSNHEHDHLWEECSCPDPKCEYRVCIWCESITIRPVETEAAEEFAPGECDGSDTCQAEMHVHGCYTPHRSDQCDGPDQFGHLPVETEGESRG